MNFLWGLGHARQPGSHADIEAARAGGKAREARTAVEELEQRIDRLVLANVALWELLKERTSLTEEDLIAKIREVDLADGRDDGKLARTIKKCAQCGRVMSPRHRRCLYCGADDLAGGAFDQAL